MTWTNPRTWSVGEKVRAAYLNAQLRDNLLFLYEGPQATLVRDTDLPVGVGEDVTCEFSNALVDTENGFDPNSPAVYVIQRDGNYEISLAALWDATAGGHRRARLKRDGDVIRGATRDGVIHAEHAEVWTPSLKVGMAISLEFTHNDTQAHSVEHWFPPWRSIILKILWQGPLDGTENDT